MTASARSLVLTSLHCCRMSVRFSAGDSAVKRSPSSPLSCEHTMMMAVAVVKPLVTAGEIRSTRNPTIENNVV